MIYSENYAALARHDPITGEIKVETRAIELSGDLFIEMEQIPRKFLIGTRVAIFLVWFFFTLLPVLAFFSGWLLFQDANKIMIFGPTLGVAIILMCQLFGRYQKFHGAEHKAIVAYEEYRCWDLKTIRAMPRETILCGTRFLSGELFLSFLAAIYGLSQGWPFLLNWIGFFID